jgi:hypothetical protein
MTMMVILEHKKSNGVLLGLLWATNGKGTRWHLRTNSKV